jgi:hypothetical protein
MFTAMNTDRIKQASSLGDRARKPKRPRDIGAIVADLEAFHERMVRRHGYLPDSTDLVRDLRREA